MNPDKNSLIETIVTKFLSLDQLCQFLAENSTPKMVKNRQQNIFLPIGIA